MADYKLSAKAAKDFDAIYEYTYKSFGEAQADLYAVKLKNRLSDLAQTPLIGRKIEERKNYHRYEFTSHTIFYKLQGDDITIIRILHNRRDFMKHLN